MIVNALRYLLGFVKFRIIGEFPERLLNQLALNGIHVWGISRSKNGICACTLRKDYPKIRTLRAKNKVRTRIVKRYGLQVMMKKHHLRVGFAIGFVMYLATLLYMSGFVWNVQITGLETLSSREVLSVCRRLGLYEGVRISSIDAKDFRTKLALEFDNIAWASVNIEGVRATVNISESKPDKNDPPENCNLVAASDGVVAALEVTSGTIKVKVGQTVKKGDLLVSGITEYKDGTFKFGVSQGKVLALTDRKYECFVPFEEVRTVRNGKVEKRRVISFFGLKVPMYLGSVSGSYETESSKSRYEKDGMYLPVTVTETVFYGVTEQAFVLAESEAREKALAQFEKIVETELQDAEILEKQLDFEVTPDGVTLKARLNCKENIAKTDLLLILG